ncbi:ATP-binding cassette domain-containing protein [Bacillus thuringiensis]|uniref:ABC transporter ATP-binding protein n=1 Tax=Bacillus thuringiensis serovar vazensis TaxID=180867 RepID=A0A243CRT4_BACTU|nr:ATP-binding cassette domain-containing protein [Bacillus thuringiensis]OTY70801.1 ABC transporter ATP-binding protein [Bacillus thuringiensis serovar vazensis]QFQ28835.1 ATP-binding cassette domain-containing protein [Bacillus thuringiensis]
MIELKDVSKSFDRKSILNNYSLTINNNEFVSIVGPSGAGKTTVLNLMGLLEKPDSGNIKIAGYENPNKKEIMYLRRYTLGYIFQNYVLMDNETVSTNLLISKTYNNNFNNNMLERILDNVGLDSTYLHKKIYQLSGGEQQRIAIARIMLKPCEIILADEPTGNLDSSNKKLIVSLFRQLQSLGKTIVCVTHDRDIAHNSDRIIKIAEMKGFKV